MFPELDLSPCADKIWGCTDLYGETSCKCGRGEPYLRRHWFSQQSKTTGGKTIVENYCYCGMRLCTVAPGAGQGEARELLMCWGPGNTFEPHHQIIHYSVGSPSYGCIPSLMCWFSTITITMILFSILNFQAIREKGFFLMGEKQSAVLLCQ